MSETTNHIVITRLQKTWRSYELMAIAITAIAIALPLMVILFVLLNASMWWLLPVSVLVFAIGLLLVNSWKVDAREVARTLNKQFPELEESTELLLKPAPQLGFLERLQVKKISGTLETIEPENPGVRKLRNAAFTALISICIATALLFVTPSLTPSISVTAQGLRGDARDKREAILPAITGVNVRIQPPAYTRLPARSQNRFNVRAEQGSTLTWELHTKGDPATVQFIFNDSSVVDLESLNKMPGSWAVEKLIKSNGFYQVKVADQLSELYQLEIIPDQQPVITVETPRPSTILEYGQSLKIPLRLRVTDDYGIAEANVVATIATGNGEAVKFTEHKSGFHNFTAGAKQYSLDKIFDLPRMGMRPGDELYFYISSIDNNRQETRSDIYTVKIEDTAALMSMDGMISGVDLKPEFFRSQRQIIIETEQLLKGRDTMSKEAFNNRCNDLGIDQKLLRLRYGKFLGEESESSIGEDGNTGHEHGDHEDDEHSSNKKDSKAGGKHVEGDEHDEDFDQKIDIENFNNAEKLMDRYSHKHDIAEDATFFDPQTKKDLKAVLAEMWDSELRLRTYKPTEALPFEYKALRLLKELQQKSREYVAKTNTKTTPLKPEKRLTGELDKIIEPTDKLQFTQLQDKEAVLRKTLAVLEDLKLNNTAWTTNAALTPGNTTGETNRNAIGKDNEVNAITVGDDANTELFSQAAGALSLKASADPRGYLSAFEAMKRLAKGNKSFNDIIVVQKALSKMLKAKQELPASNANGADKQLSNDYFKKLNKSAPRP